MALQSESKDTLLLQQDVRQTNAREKRLRMMTFDGLTLLSLISKNATSACPTTQLTSPCQGCTVLKFPWRPTLACQLGSLLLLARFPFQNPKSTNVDFDQDPSHLFEKPRGFGTHGHLKQNMSTCRLHSRVTWHAIPTCRRHSVSLDHRTTSTLIWPLVCALPRRAFYAWT